MSPPSSRSTPLIKSSKSSKSSKIRLYSILSTLLTSVGFALIILLVQTGTNPNSYPENAILSINIAGLKDNYTTKVGVDLPLHDVYNLYLRTHCEGYHWNHTTEVVGLGCSVPSGVARFLPGKLIAKDLKKHRSDQTLTSLRFPEEIDTAFHHTFNVQLHAAFSFYIISLIMLGASSLVGIWCVFVDKTRWRIALGFAVAGNLFLVIPCVLTTVVQKQATNLINEKANPILIYANHSHGFLAFSWLGFALGIFGAAGWIWVRKQK